MIDPEHDLPIQAPLKIPSVCFRQRFQGDLETELVQAFHEVALELLFIDLVQVIASQLVVTVPRLQHVVTGHEYGVSDSHQGPLGTTPSSYPLEL